MRNMCLLALLSASLSPFTMAEDLAPGAKALFYGDQATVKLAVSQASGAPTAAPAAAPLPKLASKRLPSHLGVMAWVDLVDDHGLSQRVSAKREFQSGDAIRLNVRTNRPGYLYVINLGSSGNASQLFPPPGKSIKVESGKSYSVPGKGVIRFDSRPGTEEMLIMVTPKPVEAMPQLQQIHYNPRHNDGWTQVAVSTGAKDLIVEDDAAAAMPAVYAVDPKPASKNGNSVSLRLTLRHR
ncbi:DUF4384 domain-containing protein [Laribacter hongkongensis]|uniref:DUF4384 domain-containing protein n=1 Tax=Laribacter hongkongensis TaxID=168471 RepID=UPI001EFCDC9A|nr:DUF4384 domain-containing protein [Laribacter hongkongensis]MCG9063486.1 DUF4384 domain-containing protein [Laribacter hongkongensis]